MRALLLLPWLALGCTGDVASPPGDSSSGAERIVIVGDGPADSPASPCVDLETYFQGACYLATGLDWMDYATAASTCAAVNAQPTSILSQEENDFVYSLLFHMTRAAWIGLKRQSGSFAWEDGATLEFTNWDSGEPDASECVGMQGPLSDEAHHGKWADVSCSNTYPEVVCKRTPGQ